MKSNNVLCEPQAAQLVELEQTIQAGADSLEATRLALLEVKTRGLYLKTHPTFHAYAKHRWGFNGDGAAHDNDACGGDDDYLAVVNTSYQAKKCFSPTLAGLNRAAIICDQILTLCQFFGWRSGKVIADELREQLDVTAAFCIGEMKPDSTVVDAAIWTKPAERKE